MGGIGRGQSLGRRLRGPDPGRCAAPAGPRRARLGSIADVPAERLSWRVVCLPQENLPELLIGALADRGCRAVILVGGGARPLTRSTPTQARAVRAARRRWACASSGPDRVGVIVPRRRLNTGPPRPCRQLAISPSSPSRIRSRRHARLGDDATASASRASSPLGESADVELGDILDYLAIDLATRAILIHLEGVADARPFMSAGTRGCPASSRCSCSRRAARSARPSVRGRSGCRHPAASRPGLRRGVQPRRPGPRRLDRRAVRGRRQLGADAARRGHGLRNGRLALLTNGHGSGRVRGRRAARRRRASSSAPPPRLHARDRPRRRRHRLASPARSISGRRRRREPTPPPSTCCWTRPRSTASW